MRLRILVTVLMCLTMLYVSRAQTTILSEDFSGGTLGAFTSANTIGSIVWNNTQIRGGDSGHSATRCAYFGNPADTSYSTGATEGATLTVGPFDFTGYANFTLSFNYFLQTEGSEAYDIAQVSISNDATATVFIALADNQPTAGFGNLLDSSITWQSLSLDLSAYSGYATVWVRFDFNTVDGSFNDFEGFYVDDVNLVGSGCPDPNASWNVSSSGLTVSFADASTISGTATYYWDFGDSLGTSTNQNQIYTYANAGTYTVCLTVTDSCAIDQYCATIVISDSCYILISLITSNETTAGANDGTAMAIVGGGIAPYTYLWSTGATTTAISGLAPGSYSVIVTDNFGCQDSITVAIGGGVNCLLQVIVTTTDETVAGANDGMASAVPSSGVAPYTYLWDTSDTTSSISGLAAGTYTCTITGGDGCQASGNGIVISGGCNLLVTVTGTPETQAGFNNGSATVTVSGGTEPYSITWDNFQTTATISNLPPGDYMVTVVDSAGCSAAATYIVQPGMFVGIVEQPLQLVVVKVYPNPASDIINFEANRASGVLHVYDFAGRTVIEVIVDDDVTGINTIDFRNGVYFYQLIGKHNQKLSTGKFGIQK